MNEQLDPLLRALGEVERDLERRHPAAWERVVAGEADPEDVAAERSGLDPPDEHAVFKDMFSRPASDAEIDALVGRAAAALAAGPAAQAAGPRLAVVPAAGEAPVSAAGGATREAAAVPATSAAGGATREAAAPSNVVPLAPRRARWLAAASVVSAAAAAVLMWRLTAGTPAGDLGAYGLTVRDDAVQALRSTDAKAEVSRYRVDSEVDWVLSPEREVARVVELRVVARAAGGWEELVVPVFTRSPAGALRIRGRLADVLPLKPGRWQLAFVVSAAGHAPASAAAVAGAVGDGQAIVLPQRIEVEIEAAGAPGP